MLHMQEVFSKQMKHLKVKETNVGSKVAGRAVGNSWGSKVVGLKSGEVQNS